MSAMRMHAVMVTLRGDKSRECGSLYLIYSRTRWYYNALSRFPVIASARAPLNEFFPFTAFPENRERIRWIGISLSLSLSPSLSGF